MIRRASLTHLLVRVAWRFLEQQPEEPVPREPQQEHYREPEQQQRLRFGVARTLKCRSPYAFCDSGAALSFTAWGRVPCFFLTQNNYSLSMQSC